MIPRQPSRGTQTSSTTALSASIFYYIATLKGYQYATALDFNLMIKI